MDKITLALILPYLSPYEALRLREVAKWSTVDEFNYLKSIKFDYQIRKRLKKESFKFIRRQIELHPYSIYIYYDEEFLNYYFIKENVCKIACSSLETMSGIRLTMLESLTLDDVRDSISLPSLPKLRELYINSDYFGYLTSIGEMPELESLCLRGMALSQIGGIGYYPKLTKFHFTGTLPDEMNIEDCSLSHLTSLEDVSIVREYINLNPVYYQMSNLAGLTNLKSIKIMCYALNDISILSECVHLQTVIMHNTRYIRDISALPRSISWLNINSNEVRDISCLPQFKNLTRLELNYNHIADSSPLKDCLSLRELSIFTINHLPRVDFFKSLILLESLSMTIKAEDIPLLKYLVNLSYLHLIVMMVEEYRSSYTKYIYELPKLKCLILDTETGKLIPRTAENLLRTKKLFICSVNSVITHNN